MNKLAEIEKKYDFTESTLLDIYWENHFKSLVLKVNYYWDDSSRFPAKDDRFMLIRLIGCRQVMFANDGKIFKPAYQEHPGDFSWEPVSTIIGWGDVREVDSIRSNLISPENSDELLHIGFQSMHNEAPIYWLEVICSDVEVIPLWSAMTQFQNPVGRFSEID